VEYFALKTDLHRTNVTARCKGVLYISSSY